MDPYAANEPPAETVAIEEEGVFGGGVRLIGSAKINSIREFKHDGYR